MTCALCSAISCPGLVTGALSKAGHYKWGPRTRLDRSCNAETRIAVVDLLPLIARRSEYPTDATHYTRNGPSVERRDSDVATRSTSYVETRHRSYPGTSCPIPRVPWYAITKSHPLPLACSQAQPFCACGQTARFVKTPSRHGPIIQRVGPAYLCMFHPFQRPLTRAVYVCTRQEATVSISVCTLPLFVPYMATLTPPAMATPRRV
ncbi:uncharacterized protein B0H18DRAFT_432700 [Fomitopsis serialis]|uniref:uncharacterized protein n=1 Tax=Fomitopsis serialis TaxID=139415 RepID=UPI002008C805|nr:uncharacterized protein B0H18DRAFT_432700 [Neoantrodia serialis]KAH9924458.1 hypothetical protein B0H18DRAFT_432700 [Neoantrodia serialis]